MRFCQSYVLAATSAALLSCSDPVGRHVDVVLEGGDNVDEARMELLFAKAEAVEMIQAGLADTSRAGRGRADLVDILWKLYLREAETSILPALMAHIDDPAPEVRGAVAVALTNIDAEDAIPALLQQLAGETDEEAQYRQLLAIEALDDWQMNFSSRGRRFTVDGGEELTDQQRNLLLDTVRRIEGTATKDSLKELGTEFIAKMAAQKVDEGERLLLAADVAGAEAEFLEALQLHPESKVGLHRLGFLYLENGQPDKGRQVLFRGNLLLRVPRLASPPVLDGDLSDPAWAQAARIDQFYQTVSLLRPVPAMGHSEAWIAYTDTSLWIAVKGYEEDTSTLTATVTERDGGVHQDDCAEIFFDVDLDRRFFHQTIVNSLGTITDVTADTSYSDDWNGNQRVATGVEPTFWTLEMEWPIGPMGVERIETGDIWGFNVARVRIANGGEYTQWAPTYGFSGRADRFGVVVFE